MDVDRSTDVKEQLATLIERHQIDEEPMKSYKLLVGPERQTIVENDDIVGLSRITSSINDSIIEEVEPAKQGTFLNHGP